MSKKKVSGNTMTLKDFHGGSIPSDLPLPSAPSLTVRTSDRSGGYERASSWGRSDNRSRPHMSPATRNYDDKTPFLTHAAPIGKSFDEDERKPLDGVSAPRRTISDDTLWAPPSRPQGTWSAPNAVSKLAHASALHKVSSGTWHSKTVLSQADAQVIGSSDVESGLRANVNGNTEYYDAVLARNAERVLGIDDDEVQGGRNELMDSKYPDIRSRSVAYHADGVQLPRNYGKLGGSGLQNPLSSEAAERPKLKLLPRTKALESSEPSVPDSLQGYRQVNDSGHVETVNQVHDHANFVKPVTTGTEGGKEVGHRPKLNLKPRSQPLEQLEGNTERDRNALFGGARPRELVLKERGIDDVAINNVDVVEHSSSIVRTEKLPNHSPQTRYGEKTEDAPLDRRNGKKFEKEHRVDAERVNTQRRNWRGDNRRNMQEIDGQQVSERQPSPETWRKPAEQPKSSPEAVSMSHGRAASAVELAQAFSRSVSDPKVNDRFSGQRGLNTGRTQMPFSRLVGPTPRPQINGY